MKFCSQCGASLNDDANVCSYCGKPFYSAQPQSQFQSQPQFQAQAPTMPYAQPLAQLKTDRSLIKLLLLTFITFGIYAIVWYSSVSTDINLIASRYDGKKTMHFCLLSFVVAPLTMGIGAIVWYHKLCERIGDELQRRGIYYSFGAKDFWLWNVLGSMIFVGPFIFLHNFCKAMNLLCDDFNHRG